jgi:hypothetical protein
MLREIEQAVGASAFQAPWAQLPSESDSAQPDVDILDTGPTLPELVFLIVAAFRRHPHINNVLTHISGANWRHIEQALSAILDPNAGRGALSPLAINIIDLMCADRGITGRILKPYYGGLLRTILGEFAASRLIVHVTCLFIEHEKDAHQAATTAVAKGDQVDERCEIAGSTQG